MSLPAINVRLAYLGGFVACAGAMAFALYLEHFRGLEPCAMCIFQRVAMIIAAGFFLGGAIIGPKAWRQWLWSGLAALSAATGAAIAGRHVWLQNLPPDQVPACGPTLDYMMDIMPFTDVLQTVLRGDGNCAIIAASFLGLSIPAWTLVAFVGIAIYALLVPLLVKR